MASLDYYITVVVGSTETSFAVSGVSFAETNSSTVSAGGGGGSGHVSFGDLSFTAPDQSGLLAELKNALTGAHTSKIYLQGFAATPGGKVALEQYSLADVIVTGDTDAGTTSTVALDFGQIGYKYSTVSSAGVVSTVSQGGWDLSTNASIPGVSGTPPTFAAIKADLAAGGLAPPPGAVDQFYLKIAGVASGAAVWIPVSAYDLAISNPVSVSGASRSATIPTYNFNLTLDHGAYSAALAGGVQSSEHFSSAELIDVRAGAGPGLIVHDLQFTDILLTGLSVAPGSDGALDDTLTLTFSKFSDLEFSQAADGSFKTPVGTGWDFAKHAVVTPTLPASPAAGPAAGLIYLPSASAPPPPVAANLNGHGVTDILLETSGGLLAVGEVGYGDQLAYATVGALGSEWSFHGAGDLLADGKSQFVIQNAAGAVLVGEVAGGSVAYSQVGALGSVWSFVGTGDFLGDGRSDVLLRNSSNGAVVAGEVGADGQLAYTQMAALGSEWTFHGAGDFLGDGHSSFLVENTSGALVVGESNGGPAAFTLIGALGTGWTFLETGNFLGHGRGDFLMESATGALVVGEVSGGTASYTQVGALGPDWKFVGAGDYYGTGQASFLIDNSSTGAVVTGTVVGGAAQYAQVGSLGSTWSFRA